MPRNAGHFFMWHLLMKLNFPSPLPIQSIELDQPCIMGILNLTPDSFSGDGLYTNKDQVHAGDNTANLVEATLAQARDFVKAGADILDVGGESTRPGATLVNIDTELNRVVPVIQSLTREFDIPISVDTYKHKVAHAALEAAGRKGKALGPLKTFKLTSNQLLLLLPW